MAQNGLTCKNSIYSFYSKLHQPMLKVKVPTETTTCPKRQSLYCPYNFRSNPIRYFCLHSWPNTPQHAISKKLRHRTNLWAPRSLACVYNSKLRTMAHAEQLKAPTRKSSILGHEPSKHALNVFGSGDNASNVYFSSATITY